jgi:hypothetical protein
MMSEMGVSPTIGNGGPLRKTSARCTLSGLRLEAAKPVLGQSRRLRASCHRLRGKSAPSIQVSTSRLTPQRLQRIRKLPPSGITGIKNKTASFRAVAMMARFLPVGERRSVRLKFKHRAEILQCFRSSKLATGVEKFRNAGPRSDLGQFGGKHAGILCCTLRSPPNGVHYSTDRI